MRREANVRSLLIAVLVTVSVTPWAAAPQQPEREDYTSGAYLYRAFCANCHGPTGRGDGPVADLGPRPPDLTRLRATHGGVFPRLQVRAALDGSRPVPGHETSAMPNWRDVLRRTERADERTLNIRIDALVSHIESLQK
jgi:mono/diheme cytochrome c family protein